MRHSPPRQRFRVGLGWAVVMRMAVIGCGYLGAVHAAAMASIGHEVTGIDVDGEKIAALSAGEATFFEPGLPELLRDGVASGGLRFSTDIATASDADVVFVAVGTPQRADGDAADLRFVDAVFQTLLPRLGPGQIIAGKSTVPVGTATRLSNMVDPTGATLVWNPEFLREGWAVHDTLAPDRVVVGVPDGPAGDRAAGILRDAYAPTLAEETPYLVTDLATAELVKGAANAFLATKVSFINAMAELAEAAGADISLLADALGHDERIGRRYLGAGIGFGGGCLPKDIRAFAARAEELGRGEAVGFLREVDQINRRRRDRAVQRVVEALDGRLFGARIAVLGAAFKPFSDDIRDSPALEVAVRLKGLGADVVVTDPAALGNARAAHPQLTYADERDDALRDADVVVVVTEWDLYRRELDPDHAGALVRRRIVVDGRNCLDAAGWRAAGWTYLGLGRR